MPLPITEIDDFCEASFGGYSALFTEERIDRASLPEGIYAYDIRSGEGNDFGTIGQPYGNDPDPTTHRNGP